MLVVLHPLGCTMSECEPGCGDCFPVPVPEFGTTQTRLVGSSSPAPVSACPLTAQLLVASRTPASSSAMPGWRRPVRAVRGRGHTQCCEQRARRAYRR